MNKKTKKVPKKQQKKTIKKPAKSVNKEKLLATKNNQPYVSILSVDIDPNDINNGSFELDWNDKFVIDLIKAGYKLKPTDTDNEIVDRWFQTVCRNIALEVYEQEVADPDKRLNELRVINRRDLGNGMAEIS